MNAEENKENADSAISESAESIRQWMDEKVTIEGGINPARERELTGLLQNLPGVQTTKVMGDELSITYDPTQITSSEIQERLRQAGFTTRDTVAGPAAPSVNS